MLVALLTAVLLNLLGRYEYKTRYLANQRNSVTNDERDFKNQK